MALGSELGQWALKVTEPDIIKDKKKVTILKYKNLQKKIVKLYLFVYVIFIFFNCY